MNEQYAKKSLGQHWLKDQASLEAICEAAKIKANEEVLEIGPGTGELTKELIQTGAKVTALEYDGSLIGPLKAKFTGQAQIIEGDIRTFDLTKLSPNYKIVANIPYYLTANLLRLLTDTTNKPTTTVLLVQKEVAERITKQPGQMSFISVIVQLNYDVSLGLIVPAQMFSPPPKVDSQVLILQSLIQPRFSDVDNLQLIKFIKTGFSQPRKTLANNLSSGLQKDRSIVEDWLKKSDLNPTIRAQELTLEDWYNLFKHQ